MSRIALIAAAASAALAGFSGAANAVAPDLQKYCSTQHPGSFVTRQNGTNEPLCTLRSAYSLVHYRINIAMACRLTTGSPSARGTGFGLYDCLGGSTAAGRMLAQGHYQRYCNTLNPGGQASFSYRLNDWVCTARGSQTLLHTRVSYAGACNVNFGASSPRAVGNDRRYVTCV